MGHRGGGVWVVRGSRSRATVDLRTPSRRAWEIASGDPVPFPGGTAYAGGAVDVGRVNGDRLADVALTAGGGLAVVYGSSSRTTRRLSALTADQGFLVAATDLGGLAAVSAAGDMNGDGHDELLAGGAGALGALDGASYILFSS